MKFPHPSIFGKTAVGWLAPGFLLAVAGCAGTNPQPAFNQVQNTVADRLGQEVRWPHSGAEDTALAQAVAAQLQGNLTAQSAVAIALLNNRSLQAEFEQIGISQAALSQASRLKNPEIIGSWRIPDRPPSALDMEYSVAFDFLNLLALPTRTKIATQELEQVKLKAADEVLNLAGEVQEAFYRLQAGQQVTAELQATVAINAAAADLARRQHDAGNIDDLMFYTRQAAYVQSQLELAQAQARIGIGREQLNRLLGLTGPQTGWAITGDLPTLPKKAPPLEDLEALALKQRLDLAASYQEVEALASALHLQQNTRWIPGLTVGVDTERQTDGQIITGPFIGLEVPIFDQGQPELARLAAQYRQAERRYEAQAVDVCSEVREAQGVLAAAFKAVSFYQGTLLPQRQQIAHEALLQYNAMQIDSYELLADQENVQIAQRGYVEALRDYWIARAVLERAVGGRLKDDVAASSKSKPVAETAREARTTL